MYPPLMGLSLHSNAVERTPSMVPVESPQMQGPLGALPPPDFCPSEFKVPFLDDVVSKASEYLAAVGSVGAYSHSQGVLELRQKIARWFTERDGFKADPEDLFLTDGNQRNTIRSNQIKSNQIKYNTIRCTSSSFAAGLGLLLRRRV